MAPPSAWATIPTQSPMTPPRTSATCAAAGASSRNGSWRACKCSPRRAHPLLTTARSPLPHRCVVEERELRDADFSETDRGVRNNFVGDASAVVLAAPAPPPMSAEEAKRLREEQRNAQKLQNGAPKKLARLEEQLGEAETAIAALDAEMMKAGSDVGRVRELDAQRGALQAKLDGWYAPD